MFENNPQTHQLRSRVSWFLACNGFRPRNPSRTNTNLVKTGNKTTQLFHRSVRLYLTCFAGVNPAAKPGLHSPKPGVEHVHPRSSIRSVSGGADEEILLDGHVGDERQDEQRHTEHDEPESADDPDHPASEPGSGSSSGPYPGISAGGWARAGGGDGGGRSEEP